MILYHGTNVDFGAIDLLKGIPGKDFGRGFYASDSFECAQRTALQRVDRLGGVAIVKRYTLSASACGRGLQGQGDGGEDAEDAPPCEEGNRAGRRTLLDGRGRLAQNGIIAVWARRSQI